MRIVITGATSFIGSNVVKCLAVNHIVYAIIRPNSPNRNNIPQMDNIRVIELDMSHIDELHNYIVEKVDVFYHFAWEGVRMPYRNDEIIQCQNYEATVKAVAEAKRLGCDRFIGAGSQAEYGSMVGEISESYECNPNCEYGKYKNKAFHYLKEYAEEYELQYIWVRIFSVYGKGDYSGSLVMSCISKMLKNEDVELTECTQEWDYLYIEDIVRVLSILSDAKCNNGVYNIASGIHMPLKYYVEMIKRVTKSSSELKYGEIPYSAQGKVSFVPSIKKLQDEIGWKPMVTFEEGILAILQGVNK